MFFARRADLCVSSLCKPYLCIIQKKTLTTLLRSYVSFLCTGHAAVSRVTPSLCRGHAPARNSYLRTSIRRFHRFAPREHHGRSFRRETWRVTCQGQPQLLHSSSPGCLPELWPWDMACGIRCPPFVIRKAYASDGSSTPRRKSSAIR